MTIWAFCAGLLVATAALPAIAAAPEAAVAAAGEAGALGESQRQPDAWVGRSALGGYSESEVHLIAASSVIAALILGGGLAQVFYLMRIGRKNRELQRLIEERDKVRDHFDNFLNLSLDLYCVLDPKGNVLSINPAFEKVLGYAREEVLSRPIADLLHPEDRAATRMAAVRLAGGEGLVAFETRAIVKGNGYKTVLWDAVTSPDGEEIFAIGRDQTQERAAAEEIRHANATLEARVIERTRALQDEVAVRRRAEQEAEKANLAKSAFLSSMSHELRTPMNAILGFSQLLMYSEKYPLADAQREYLNLIVKSGNYLLDLINEVLELSKIEAGRVSISIENVDLGEVLEECILLIEPRAAESDLHLVRPGEDRFLPGVRADRTRLKQVLLNVLSNAVKYNSRGGQVRVAVGDGGDGAVRVSVSDTGPGIAEANRDLIFQPFHRLVDEDGTAIEGTGIGLTITRQLLGLMGGKIDFDSVEGEGTTFHVDLPVAIAEAPVKAHPARDLNPVPSGTVGKTVLYVEDNPANLKLMEGVMRDMAGIALVSAHNGEMGVALAEQYRPDVVILDINLPGIDGFQVLKELRDLPMLENTPIIALTANATESDRLRGREAGFAAYLTKPIQIDELLSVLERQLHRAA